MVRTLPIGLALALAGAACTTRPSEPVPVDASPSPSIVASAASVTDAALGDATAEDAAPSSDAAAFGASPIGASSSLDGGPAEVPDADQVVNGLRPAFGACLSEGLQKDPRAAGRVVFSASVEPTGKVSAVTIGSRSGTLSDAVLACMSLVLRKASFAHPLSGHAALLQVPFTFAGIPDAGAGAAVSAEDRSSASFVSACTSSLVKRGAASELASKQCACSWTVMRKTFSAAELNSAKLSDDLRYPHASSEARETCRPPGAN